VRRIFQIRVLNNDKIARRLLNSQAQRGAFSLIPGTSEKDQRRVFRVYFELLYNPPMAINCSLI
jgi:hypothetical protein